MAFQRIEELSQQQQAEIAATSPFQKWASMNQLRLLGLPTLDALCLLPVYPERSIASAIKEFATAHGVGCVQIRSDRAREYKSYYRGGNSFPIEKATAEVAALLRQKRTVILLEPTNRFTNKLNVGILIDPYGRLVMEALGPGYDVSDLNRGGIGPEIFWKVENINWQRYEEPWAWDFCVTRSSSPTDIAQRRHRRLNRLATELLPSFLGKPADSISAQAWLKEQGFTDLWEDKPLVVDLAWLSYWYDCAFMVANHSFGSGKVGSILNLSGSLLEDGRFVFWDIVDSRRKFARTVS
jgi:hypothetical protein